MKLKRSYATFDLPVAFKMTEIFFFFYWS